MNTAAHTAPAPMMAHTRPDPIEDLVIAIFDRLEGYSRELKRYPGRLPLSIRKEERLVQVGLPTADDLEKPSLLRRVFPKMYDGAFERTPLRLQQACSIMVEGRVLVLFLDQQDNGTPYLQSLPYGLAFPLEREHLRYRRRIDLESLAIALEAKISLLKLLPAG